MSAHTERDFETAIEAGLTGSGGFQKRDPSAYDETLALFPEDVTGFLKDSQPAKWQGLEALLGDKTSATVVDSLGKEMELKGTLHVLRHGFKCYGKTLRLAYFRPNTAMNSEAAANYAKNRLTITRQVAFTSVMKRADGKHRRCVIDVTLAVNGIPVVTGELKNPLTGQRAADAMQQYETERDERDLLFAFKRRALVHFAVDPDEVWMTTRLRGKETHFLPFNRGNNHGAGNPPVEGNWKTHYLWDEVLQADSLLEILQRFMHLEVKERQVTTTKGVRTVRKETLIFPRYHQLDAVRAAGGACEGPRFGAQLPGPALGRLGQVQLHRLAGAPAGQPARRSRTRRCFIRWSSSPTAACSTSSCRTPSTSSSTNRAWCRRSTRTPSSWPGAGGRVRRSSSRPCRSSPSSPEALSTLEKKGSGVQIDTAGKRFAVIVDEAHSSQSGETATD
jgi:type I restriction enzyme R subunit